jgi:hypothetical protein
MAVRDSDAAREILQRARGANCTEDNSLSSTAHFTNNTTIYAIINHPQIRLEGPKTMLEIKFASHRLYIYLLPVPG